MEYLGVIAFVLVMFIIGLSDDVKKLKKQIKRIISKSKIKTTKFKSLMYFVKASS